MYHLFGHWTNSDDKGTKYFRNMQIKSFVSIFRNITKAVLKACNILKIYQLQRIYYEKPKKYVVKHITFF